LDGEDNIKSSVLCDLHLFSGSCSCSSASKAFIFSFYNTNGYDPVKLTQYQYLNKAMYSCYRYGPTFGENLGQHDIYAPNDAVNGQTAFTYCGSTYSPPTGNSVGYCAFFAGGSHFTPTDIEVFYETISQNADPLVISLFHALGQWGPPKKRADNERCRGKKMERAAQFFFSPRSRW